MGAERFLDLWHLLCRGFAGIRRVTVVGPSAGATACHRAYLFFLKPLAGGLFPPVFVVCGGNEVEPLCTVLNCVCDKGI